MTALAVDGLSVGHRDDPTRLVTAGVSFDVAAGEALAIVGESGSGKSVTARAITGLLPPNLRAQGLVTIAGTRTDADPTRTAPLLGGTASILLQDPFTMLHPLRKIGAQLADGLDRRRTRGNRAARRATIAARLSEVGLDPAAADRYPHQLSGGMRQRVGIAAALLRDPAILIADEPTTALDATTQRDIVRLLLGLRERRQLTLVLITHDLDLAFAACERALVMYAGSPVEYGTTAVIRRRPTHPYTAALIDASPSLDGRLERLGGIAGNVPALDDVGDRCAFADRCRFAIEPCRQGRPALVERRPEHLDACIRSDDLDLTRQPRHVVADPPVDQHATTLITAEHVTHTFTGGQRPALDDVSVQIAPHEAVAIVGESGSGKTTLARILIGLQHADDAQITLDGQDISDWRSISRSTRHRLRRQIQMVFQDPYSSLDPRRTVGRTLREALRAFADPDGTSVEQLLARVHLPAAVAAEKPGGLSGGERQRVAIARALATRPRLIILDEAVSALDVSVQAQILDLVNELRTTSELAVLLITHDLAVARQTTDRTYVLRAGSVVEHGPTAEILARPTDAYTQRLIASVPDADGNWLTD